MSEEERLTRKYELKSILIFLPIKFIISLIVVANGSVLSLNIPLFFAKIADFIVIYSILSIIIYFSQAVGNWLVGIILFILICVGAACLHLPDTIANLIGFFMCIGGFSLDFYRVVQYIRLSRKAKEPPTETAVKQDDVALPTDKQ